MHVTQQMNREMGKSGRMMIREAWTEVEDKQLIDYVKAHGPRKWGHVSQHTGIKRSGKSCRLRWLNYLRLGIKKGDMSPEEEELIIRLHNLLGNRWSLIAGRLPGRSDNEIKNYWNTTLAKRRHPPPMSSPENNVKEKESPRLPPPTPTPDTELLPTDDHPIDEDEAFKFNNYSSLLLPYHPGEIMNLSGNNYLFQDEDVNDDGLLYLQGFDDDDADGIWGSGNNTSSSSTSVAGARPNALWSDFFTK